MLIQLPGGGAITADGTTIGVEDNGEIVLHTTKALRRLIERWKDKPVLRALVAALLDEVQAAETVLWDVILKRLPDDAEGPALDALGRLVGQPRNGLGDAGYRVHVKARIAINQSFGRPQDVIGVLQLIDSTNPAPSEFRLTESGVAAFAVDYLEPPVTVAMAAEIPDVVRQTRAAGVGGVVRMVTDADVGALYGWDATGLYAERGWGYTGDGSGGLYGWSALA